MIDPRVDGFRVYLFSGDVCICLRACFLCLCYWVGFGALLSFLVCHCSRQTQVIAQSNSCSRELLCVLRYNRIANTGHSRRNSWLLGLSFFVSLFEELSTWLAAGETVDVPLKTMHIEGGYKFCHMLKRDCQDKKY